jgi:tight adherence protein C
MTSAFLISILILIALAVLLATYALGKLKAEVPKEAREYMDPLPGALNLLWPLIAFITYHLSAQLSAERLERINKRLQETGAAYMLTAEQYVAVRTLSTLLALGLAWFCMWALDEFNVWVLLALTALGNLYPEIWLRDKRMRREKEILKALPVFLDYITLAVEAGLNLTGAIKQAVDKGPRGALRNEFNMVTRDLRAGVPRADALRRMEARLGMKEIASFVGTVIQAERMGASVGAALRIQSQQRRLERFQRAEKMAMEAPVKLIMPLIAFIFPVTFIVLGFPIAMKFMQGGLL